MGELQKVHGDRIDFTLVPWEETLAQRQTMLDFGFDRMLHGLVGFNGEGDPVVKMEGHRFLPEELEAAVQTVLAVE